LVNTQASILEIWDALRLFPRTVALVRQLNCGLSYTDIFAAFHLRPGAGIQPMNN
jgi:hypothetical protein